LNPSTYRTRRSNHLIKTFFQSLYSHPYHPSNNGTPVGDNENLLFEWNPLDNAKLCLTTTKARLVMTECKNIEFQERPFCGNEEVGMRRGKKVRLVKKGKMKKKVFTNSNSFKTKTFG
jgi:hypothetical protein